MLRSLPFLILIAAWIGGWSGCQRQPTLADVLMEQPKRVEIFTAEMARDLISMPFGSDK
jgi:hypothetical protein